ncbi:MAG: CDC27 family protein [Sulfurimonas sp.]|nr:CDC27 family protein [Sulfurimonas sp.]
MLNINELETRWRKHKIKEYTPLAVIALITVLIGIFSIYVVSTQQVETQKEPSTLKADSKQEEEQKKEITQSSKALKKVTLAPSFKFISNIDNDIELDKKKEEKVKKKKYVEKTNTILIKRQSTQEDISYVIKRFKNNNDPALSLFIAKKYYELGEYDSSYNYALTTNQIDDSIDDSWLIFSKSLVKLNRKKEAIKVLKKYIKHSNSSQAKLLLRDIMSGKFR